MVCSDRWIWERWSIVPSTWESVVEKYGGVIDKAPPSESVASYAAIEVPPLQKAKWIAALSIPLPTIGYFLLFCVSSWVYRGFRVPESIRRD
jgi:hypothetical protein